MEMNFDVSIYDNRAYRGDITVTVAVLTKEYELLKQCGRKEMEIEECDGLKELQERIAETIIEENGDFDECFCNEEEFEEIDYENAEYAIQFPEEIYNEVHNHNEE